MLIPQSIEQYKEYEEKAKKGGGGEATESMGAGATGKGGMVKGTDDSAVEGSKKDEAVSMGGEHP